MNASEDGEIAPATKRVAVIAAPTCTPVMAAARTASAVRFIERLCAYDLAMFGCDAQAERDQGRAHQAFERAADIAAPQENARARNCGCVKREPGEGHQAEHGTKQHQVHKCAVAGRG